MLKLFGIDITKIVIYLGGGLIAALLLFGGYLLWKHNVEKEAQTKFNNKQLEQVVKDQKQQIDQLLKINKDQEEIIISLNKQNDDLKIKLTDLDTYLNSEQARKDDRPASNVLKKTILELIGASK